MTLSSPVRSQPSSAFASAPSSPEPEQRTRETSPSGAVENDPPRGLASDVESPKPKPDAKGLDEKPNELTSDNNVTSFPPLSAIGSHPLLFAPARLPICRIQDTVRFPGLPDDADLWVLPPGGHPIRRVEIMGLVVSFEIKTAFVLHVIDDGTGTVAAVSQIPKDKQYSADPPKTFEIGTLVRVNGFITTFDDLKQVNVLDMRVEEAGSEIVWWLQLVELDRDVYSKPWDIVAGLKD